MNTDEYIKEIEAENEILRSILEKCGITKDNISEFEEAAHAIKANKAINLFWETGLVPVHFIANQFHNNEFSKTTGISVP